MTIEIKINEELYDRLLRHASWKGVSIDRAIEIMAGHHVDGKCPYCGGEVVQTAKHSDLDIDAASPVFEYADVTIHRCEECGKYHADIENQ